jgi:hypothetical protein
MLADASRLALDFESKHARRAASLLREVSEKPSPVPPNWTCLVRVWVDTGRHERRRSVTVDDRRYGG